MDVVDFIDFIDLMVSLDFFGKSKSDQNSWGLESVNSNRKVSPDREFGIYIHELAMIPIF